jgi:hypothetical protein
MNDAKFGSFARASVMSSKIWSRGFAGVWFPRLPDPKPPRARPAVEPPPLGLNRLGPAPPV